MAQEKQTGVEERIGYTFRLPRGLKDALITDAETHSRSLNQHVVDILAAYLEGRLIDAGRLLADPAVRRLIRAAVELQGSGRKR